MNFEPTGTIDDQYWALRDAVGIVQLDGRTRIELTGSDRAKFLQNFCTNDIKKLTPGTGCEAFITNVQGKILGFVNVFCRQQSIVIDTVPGQAEPLIAHLDRYLITEDVELVDVTHQTGTLVVAGAKSEELLSELSAADLPGRICANTHSVIDKIEADIARVAMLGEPTFLLTCSQENVQALIQAIVSSGADGPVGSRPVLCSTEAAKILRVEAGFPEFGIDISDANLPQEIDRNEQAISFTKGCYLGQETVARIDALGHVNRMLGGLRFFDEDVPNAGVSIRAGDKVVGQVTSAAFSPGIKAPLALAYVRRENNSRGTVLTSDCGDAEVIDFPISRRKQLSD